MQNVNFNTLSNGIQKLALFNYGFGNATEWWIDNILIYSDPMHSITYLDGAGKVTQVQTEADDGIIFSEAIYDDLGRAAIQTKPGKYTSGWFAYRPGFVTGFD